MVFLYPNEAAFTQVRAGSLARSRDHREKIEP